MVHTRDKLLLVLVSMVIMSAGRTRAQDPWRSRERLHNAHHLGSGSTNGGMAQHRSMEVHGKIRSILKVYAQDNWPQYLPTINSVNGTKCHDALETFHNSPDLYSAQMVDSWGKFPDGIGTRSPAVFGIYSGCLAAQNKTFNIKGRYCLIIKKRNTTIPPPEETFEDPIPRIGMIGIIPPYSNIQYGTCMPDACTEQQLQSSLSDVSDKVISVHCNKDSVTLDGLDISFIVFCSVFLVLMLSGAAVDYYIEIKKDEKLKEGPLRFLLPFSVTTNLKKVFAINTKPNPVVISCLNGMRVMSMCWVVMAHQHMKLMSMKIYDFLLIPQKISGVLFQIIQNGDISVDSFFFLSGLLIAYGVLREMKKTGKLNIIMFYVHRIIRLTPPIAMCVWFYASVNRHLVSGPQAYGADKLAESCRKNGWRDITYLTNANWDNYERGGCMGQCWYTAVDTQLYLIAPLLIVPLHYFKDLGKAWLYIMTLTSLIIPGAIYNRSLSDTERLYVNETYMTPWCRANSWIVGIWTGYIIFKTGNQLKLKKWQVVVGWTAAFATAWMVLLGMYNVKQGEATTTYIIYEASHRAAWAACLGWVAIACHNGYGGIVNGFLSHPVWQPVSRLTYGLYLISFEIQDDLVKYSRKNLFYYTPLNMIIQIAGALFISGIGAVLLTLVAEGPVLGLEKLIFDRPGHGTDKPAIKKLQEPAANGNVAILNEENELKQLSGENENAKTEGYESTNTKADIKE